MIAQPKSVDDNHAAIWTPETDAAREQIRQQLDRLVASPGFVQSRRYSRLLRYIVEEALEGRADRLKERTIGIEVFEREPAYDTNADPVVRTTAAQVRRRIAQYYSQPEHEHEIVIDLPSGAYIPEFRQASLSVVSLPLIPAIDRPAPEYVAPRLRRIGIYALSALVLVLAVTAAFVLLRPNRRDPAINAFWGPVWGSSEYVTFVMGRASGDSDAPNNTSAARSIRDSLIANRVPWPDAITLSSLVGVATVNGKKGRLQRANSTRFADLRDAPAVLIGGFNNSWIMRLGPSFRFRLRVDHETGDGWIEDRERPSLHGWKTNFNAPFSTFDQDFGLITRVIDPTTERPLVIASGIASYGTIAAGEFLTTEKYMHTLLDRAPKGWDHKNVQVVFSTNVINGNSGPPHILATYFW